VWVKISLEGEGLKVVATTLYRLLRKKT